MEHSSSSSYVRKIVNFSSSKRSVIVVFIVFFTFSLWQVSEAGIKCWVCNSRNDLGCGDPFDNSSFPISDCDAEYDRRDNLKGIKATMCRKIVQKVQGEWRWIRSCAFLGEPGIGGDERYCKRRTGTFDIYQEDCLCRGKDGCNAGNSWQASIGVVGVLTSISLMTILKLLRPFTSLVIL
ncbi:unnamed protein product [Orchesella dallaii]|uniref:Protein sleepless n=1 Tax=Orchesella dallaii TaxID=48710 RepID=A0ABP1R9I2_9HEXA